MSFFRRFARGVERTLRPIVRPAALAAAAYFAPAALPLISRVIGSPPPRATEEIYDSPRGYFPTADSAYPIMPGGFGVRGGFATEPDAYDEEEENVEDDDPFNCSCR